jgi:hypothetical protein
VEESIAELSLRARSAERGDFAIHVQIGRPVLSDRGPWACPMAINGLSGKLSPACGEDSMQALCLAIWFVAQKLHDFVQKGGRLWNVGDDPSTNFPLEAYFRPLLPPQGKGAA